MIKNILYHAIALLSLVCILTVCSSCKKNVEYLPDMPITPDPDMSWDVITDYSGLTAYRSPRSMHTRLASGALPELVPSDGYGMLLPYSGSYAKPGSGGYQVTKYGLVTIDGVIVTDAVYDSISRVNIYTVDTQVTKPAYMLGINRPGKENQ